MQDLDRKCLDEVIQRYPTDPCRQIAAYVLESPNIPDEDRDRANGILQALEAEEHVRDLTVIKVDQWQLRTSALADAERLWQVYGECKNSAVSDPAG